MLSKSNLEKILTFGTPIVDLNEKFKNSKNKNKNKNSKLSQLKS